MGAAAPAPLVTPTTNAAAVMAADQPDMPNNGLAGKIPLRQSHLIFINKCIIYLFDSSRKNVEVRWKEVVMIG